MEGTTSDKCYIYFDKVVTVDMYCNNKDNLADCIKTFGNEGYDKSNIYIHDESLKNGAGDNSYRFAGSSDYVNNYVCFGTNESPCPSDNLYRIIGVFGDNVKLIKYDYVTSDLLGIDGDYNKTYDAINTPGENLGNNLLSNIGTYYWNSSKENIWSTSSLNTINLNNNYLSSLDISWQDLIEELSWQVGGNTNINIETSLMYQIYQNEIVSPIESTIYRAKIGLMYVSDYGYATPQKYWTYYGYNSDSTKDYRAVINENWLYMGLYEWTITRDTTSTTGAFSISSGGRIDCDNVGIYSRSIRPTFYLKSTTKYVLGSGTKISPIYIN